jgi:hypothetical protein
MKIEIVIEAKNKYPQWLVVNTIELLFLNYGKSPLMIVNFQPCFGFIVAIGLNGVENRSTWGGGIVLSC